MKILTTVMLILLFFNVNVQAKELSLEQVLEGICRVTSVSEGYFQESQGVSYGTGTVVWRDSKNYYIVTNGHVATRAGTTVGLEFFREGMKSSVVQGNVVWRNYAEDTSLDAAIVTVRADIFSTHPPRIIQFAPRTYVVKQGDKIYGAGCPSGRWAQAWQARVIRLRANTISFNMAPVGGQSGSGVLATIEDANGEKQTRYVGLLTWRMGANKERKLNYGAGVNLQRLYSMIKDGDKTPDRLETSWKPVSTTGRCKYCKNMKDNHFVIKYDSGSYHMTNNSPTLFCPKYRIEKETEVLGIGTCIPFSRYRRPPTQPTPPSDRRPPIGDSDSEGEAPNIFPDDEQTKRITELEGIIAKLKAADAGFDGQIRTLEDEKKKLEESKKTLTETNNIQKTDIKNRKASIEVLKKDKKKLIDTAADLAQKHKDKLNSLNIPFFSQFGGLGTILAFILSTLAGGTVITTIWHKFGYPYLVKKFGFLPTKIIERIGKKKLSKYLGESSDKSEVLGYNKVENTITPPTSQFDEIPSPVVTPVNEAWTMNEGATPQQSVVYVEPKGYAEQLFASHNNQLRGETYQQWAIKGGLYKIAVGKLKRGELLFSRGVPLQGCEQTSDAIETWVTEQFLLNVTTQSLGQVTNIYHEAYIGFLYWGAVQKLKCGELNVLGHVESGRAIEDCVNQELIKKTGIPLSL